MDTVRPGATVRTRLYRHGILQQADFPVADISDYLAAEGSVIWLDLCGPTQADFDMIDEEFGLHELAVEDALHASERPKLDRYATHLFLDAYAVDPHTATRHTRSQRNRRIHHPTSPDHGTQRRTLRPRTSHPALGRLTRPRPLRRRVPPPRPTRPHRRRSLCRGADPRREHRAARRPAVRGQSPTHPDRPTQLLPAAQEPRPAPSRRASHAGGSQHPRPSRPVHRRAADEPYYQDVYDHVLRVTEWTESLRDLVTTIVETNLTVQANRMNLIMKKVTSWAAIIAVPTAITGFYGQNLPYPGFDTHAGVITSTTLILTLSGLLYLTFKRKDWL